MPTYEYRCDKCGDQFEVVQSFKDRPLRRHTQCGGGLAKVFHPRGVVFKGSGFYSTDSRAKQSESKTNETGTGETKTGETKSGESKSGQSKSGETKSGESKSDSKNGSDISSKRDSDSGSPDKRQDKAPAAARTSKSDSSD